MKPSGARRAVMAMLLGLNMLLASGCAVTGRGYGRGTDVRLGVGYDDRGFNDYGGWGPGYRIGPFRHGIRPIGPGRIRPGPRGFRPAPQKPPCALDPVAAASARSGRARSGRARWWWPGRAARRRWAPRWRWSRTAVATVIEADRLRITAAPAQRRRGRSVDSPA